jgi:hypothetical protein
MRTPKQYLQDRSAWKQYETQLQEMDRNLGQLEASGLDQGGPEYTEAWNDRMGYAANCYPGAPEAAAADPEAEAVL